MNISVSTAYPNEFGVGSDSQDVKVRNGKDITVASFLCIISI